jgi:hypothetical protein
VTADALTTTEQKPKRKRRPYLNGKAGFVNSEQAVAKGLTGGNAKRQALIERIPKLQARVADPAEEFERQVAERMLAKAEAQLALTGVVRSRVDWANVPEHVAEFPGHILTCTVGKPHRFDAHVNPATGMHHNRRPAEYCSDYHQAKAKRDRAKIKASVMGAVDAGVPVIQRWLEDDTARTLVRVLDMLTYASEWPRLGWTDWEQLDVGAPYIAAGLRVYEVLLESNDGEQRRRIDWIGIAYPARANRLRGQLITAIDAWFDQPLAHLTSKETTA